MNILRKIPLYFVIILGVFLLFFSLVGIQQGIYNVKDILTQGVAGISADFGVSDTVLIIRTVEKNSAADEAGVKNGDTILSINDKKIVKKDYTLDSFGPNIVGTTVKLTVKRENENKAFSIVKKPARLEIKLLQLGFLVIMPLAMLFYILTGLWIVIKEPKLLETKLISMVCYTFGCLIFILLDIHQNPSPLSKILHYSEVREQLSDIVLFVPSFWIYLLLNFPIKHQIVKSKKLLIIFIIFLLPVLTCVWDLLPSSLEFGKPVKRVIELISLGYIFAGIIIGIVILSRKIKKETNTLQRRQLKLIQFGIRSGGLSIICGWASILIFSFLRNYLAYFDLIFLSIFLIGQLGGIIIPFTFLNGVMKKKLLETEWAIKKKLYYFGASLILFVGYLVISFFISSFFIMNLNLQDTSVTIMINSLIVLTFFPINKKFQGWLELKFYPERTKYRQNLKEFEKGLQSIIEISNLMQNFTHWLEETFKIRPAIAFALAGKSTNVLPFNTKEEKSVINKIRNNSVFFWDELQTGYESEIVKEEKEWVEHNKISVSLPLISYGEMIGILYVGKKANEQDFTGEDLEILQEAAGKSAAALQNLILQSEYIEKKRLDKELNLARGIQKQLLPQSIPDIKGLEIFGKMRPCFEVAGDYYDFYKINENEIVLTIADVSGKGAGAAMLMSNLQAGLHSALRFTHSLSSIVFELNNMINQNTNPSQFITFFIGTWNNETKTFQYVNAGHNPGIVLRKNGDVIKLEATGFFLGPIPNMEYNSQSVFLEKDDILIIYTDGIEETFNSQEEQFGLDRILHVLQVNRHLKPDQIAEVLFSELEAFSAGLPYFDDATLIIAKLI